MFEEVAKDLKQKTGCLVTDPNCENRWKHLERMYKKYIDNNSKTGRGRKEFEYAEEMHKILGKKNIAPTLVLASDTVENESFHTNQGPNLQDKRDSPVGGRRNIRKNCKYPGEHKKREGQNKIL